MKKIYFDLDATLSDTPYKWLTWLNKNYTTNGMTLNELVHYDFIAERFGSNGNDFWRAPGVYDNVVEPLEGAVDLVNWCKNLVGPENVNIITWSAAEMIAEKDRHINRFYDIPKSQVFHTHSKFMKSHDGILIDDYHEHIFPHIKINGRMGILFNRNNDYGWSKNRENTLHEDFRHKLKIVTNYEDMKEVLKRNYHAKRKS